MTTYLRGISTREDWAWQPVALERWPSKPRLGVKWHYPGAYRYRYDDHDICLQAVKSWDLYHRRRGSRMMEYSGLVCQHLFYIEGRSRWDDMMWRPASNGNWQLNTNHLGFQFLAGAQDKPPTDIEVKAMAEVTAKARQQGAGRDVFGHRDGYATACPGDALYRRLPDIRRIADATTLDEKDWFDMATKKDLEDVVRAVVGDAVWSHDVDGRPAGWWQKQTHGIVRRFLGPVGPPTSKVPSDLADLKERLAAVEKAVAVKEPLAKLDEMKAER